MLKVKFRKVKKMQRKRKHLPTFLMLLKKYKFKYICSVFKSRKTRKRIPGDQKLHEESL